MKTKILIIAALVFTGLTFSSCTKDNSLTDEASFQQSETISTPNAPSDLVKDWDHPYGETDFNKLASGEEPGSIGKDMISNTPDPFRNYTTIRYIVRQPAKVTLAVYYGGGQELVTILVNNAYQEPGLHMVKFNASGLPYGKYIAKLIIRTKSLSVVYKEEMTKSAFVQQDDESTITD